MSPQEAEKIINRYGEALASNENTARRISSLPCSKAKIRFAFYVYLKELISKNLLNKDIGNNLVMTYSYLDSFVVDSESQEINEIGERIKKEGAGSLETKLVEKYFQFVTSFVTNVKAIEEINSYISECQNMG